MKKVLLGTIFAVGAIAGLTTSASAYIVCNHDGSCWHTDTRYTYPDGHYDYHPDDWYFHRTWDRDHWHDYHEGRGYWRDGAWVTF